MKITESKMHLTTNIIKKMAKAPFTSATTLYDFLQIPENRNGKALCRYLRRINKVAYDGGYDATITVEKYTSSRVKLIEQYGPLTFGMYVDEPQLFDYLDFKINNQRNLQIDEVSSSALIEKELTLVDLKLDIEEVIQQIYNTSGYEHNKLEFIYKDLCVEIVVDDIKQITIEFNKFGRGTIHHHFENFEVNDFDLLNSKQLILVAKIVEAMQNHDFVELYNTNHAVNVLARNAKVTIPELEQKDAIKKFIATSSDEPVSFENRGQVITLTKSSRIKCELVATHSETGIKTFRKTFKVKDYSQEDVYELVKLVAALS